MYSMFAKKVSEATPREAIGLYFLAGQYPVIQVDQLKLITSTKPGRIGAEMFVAVFDILESRVQDRPAGMRAVSHTLNSNHAGAADDCKRMLQALFPEVDAASFDENALVALTSPNQPAHGRLVTLECYTKYNDEKNTAFTKHIYRPVAPEVQAKAAEMRAKVGLPAF